MGSTWILRRLEALPLGSSSTSAVAAQGVRMQAGSSCVSGRSMVSSGRHQTGAASDVVLKSAFPELLSAGASGGPPPLDWWPTQINRLGDGGPLGPHLVERGGIQIERRRGGLADEAVHGKHFNGEKHLFGSGKAAKKTNFS